MEKAVIYKPTRQQLAWQDMELGIFCHFGLYTFYDEEKYTQGAPATYFNPTAFDARQWAKTVKQAGFKYFILTAKHHEGFCLWPTKTTDYSVKSSPWKQGKGDIVKECSEACREEGILLGLYLSPYDRYAPCYKDEKAYDDYYSEQLTELLTWYGPLIEVWFDGNGTEGHIFDWARYMNLIEKYQPDAMVFNMGKPTIRWVGNEDGVASYPCWNTATEAKLNINSHDVVTWLPETSNWLPAECDVPIRKGHWGWEENDEHSLLSLEALMDIYYRSVGHGTNLLLNIAPDRRGLMPEVDVQRAIEFGEAIKKRFEKPLMEVSGTGQELTAALPHITDVDHAILMEEIAYGERVRDYILEAKYADGWVELCHGSAIGHKKIDKFKAIATDAIRLRITGCDDVPLIRSFKVFSTGK